MNFSIVLLVCAIAIFDFYFHEMFNFAVGETPVGNKEEVSGAIKLITDSEYPLEKHTVQTEDGYILQMHRIPHGLKNRNAKKKKSPIFLQHGMLGSSADFVHLGPNKSLAFFLADAGFDVWMGNLRGNTFSKSHTNLQPSDPKFWNFTWHESGIYDLPAQIDYIESKTKTTKIYYVGFSMGTTVFFVMASTLPEYNNKIEKAFLMAPVAEIKILNKLIISMESLTNAFKFLLDKLAQGEFSKDNDMALTAASFICLTNLIQQTLCNNVLFFVGGSNLDRYDRGKMASYLKNYPAGYSAKGLYHFAQLLTSGEFKQYDYGVEANKAHYESATPPFYNLSQITAKMHFYLAPDDSMSVVKDILFLGKKLSSLKKVHLIDYPEFSHLDFILSDDAAKLVYKTFLKEMGLVGNKFQFQKGIKRPKIEIKS